jgi:hypothetical protein
MSALRLASLPDLSVIGLEDNAFYLCHYHVFHAKKYLRKMIASGIPEESLVDDWDDLETFYIPHDSLIEENGDVYSCRKCDEDDGYWSKNQIIRRSKVDPQVSETFEDVSKAKMEWLYNDSYSNDSHAYCLSHLELGMKPARVLNSRFPNAFCYTCEHLGGKWSKKRMLSRLEQEIASQRRIVMIDHL